MRVNLPILIQEDSDCKSIDRQSKLINRINDIQLHAHSYAFYLNLQHGSFNIFDLCDFASYNSLQGINLHIDAGGSKSIANYNPKQLQKLRTYLENHQLNINLEASNTTKKTIKKSVRLAKSLGAKNIRVYDRYKGKLSAIIEKSIKRMSEIAEIAEKHDLHFVIEPHEVLKSKELVQIVKAVNSNRVNLLFDFGNMLSTSEQPLEALEIMKPYIKQVHLKGANVIETDNGYAQLGVRQGDDKLPHQEMLHQLLMIGDNCSQVGAFSLEQQVGYYAQPYRFQNETEDPMIPKRKPSKTKLNDLITLEQNLNEELQHAHHQVSFIRKTLETLKTIDDI